MVCSTVEWFTNMYTQCTLVTFDNTSPGQVAMVIYEWQDVKYLGKVTSKVDDLLPVSISYYRTNVHIYNNTMDSRRRMFAHPMQ